MSDKKYTEDAIYRLGGIIAEKFEDQLAKLIENIDGHINRHVRPVREELRQIKSQLTTLEAVTKDINKGMRSTEKTLGNTAHQVVDRDLIDQIKARLKFA